MIFDLVGQIVAKTEYIIPLFLATIFAAGVLSSRSKIPYTIILVGIGVVISLLSYSNFNIVGKDSKSIRGLS